MTKLGGWIRSVTRTSQFDFGSGPDAYPAYQWDLLFCVFALEDGNLYISLFFSGFFLNFVLEDANFYMSLVFLGGFFWFWRWEFLRFPDFSAFLRWKMWIFIFPCFFLAFCEFWIRRWEFLHFPSLLCFLHWKIGIFTIPFFVNFGLEDGNFYISLIFLRFFIGRGEFLYFRCAFWLFLNFE